MAQEKLPKVRLKSPRRYSRKAVVEEKQNERLKNSIVYEPQRLMHASKLPGHSNRGVTTKESNANIYILTKEN